MSSKSNKEQTETRLLTILFLCEFISPDGCELSLSLAVQGSWEDNAELSPRCDGTLSKEWWWWWQDWIGSEWVFFYPSSDNRNCRRVVELCRFHFPSLIGQVCLRTLLFLSCALSIRLKCDGFPFATAAAKEVRCIRRERGTSPVLYSLIQLVKSLYPIAMHLVNGNN